MNYFVYIIYSKQRDRFYIGQTQDVTQRIQQHRIRRNLGTDDWELVHQEVFLTRADAMRREASIKARKSRKFIQSLCKLDG